MQNLQPLQLTPSAPAAAPSPTSVPIMTPEQIETMKRQINDYCQIVYRSYTTYHQMTGEPGQDWGAKKTISEKDTKGQTRWSPTTEQLQVLENLFASGEGTPAKTKIKELVATLQGYGPITESNVYNWFQNRKARAKRRQQSNEKAAAAHKLSGAGGSQTNLAAPTLLTPTSTPPPPTAADAAAAVPVGDPSLSQGMLVQDSEPIDLSGSAPALDAPALPAAEVHVKINDKVWKVEGGLLDVASTFGPGMTLFDSAGRVVGLTADGVVEQPLQHGGLYSIRAPAPGL